MLYIRPSFEWNAPPELDSAGHPMPAGAKPLVVLHHTYRPHRPCGDRLSQERADLRGVDNYHRAQNWGGIGYHFAGFQSGNIYQCRSVTRTGAHTEGQNSKSIGYVLFIDGDVHPPTAAAMETFQDWLRGAVTSGLLAPDFAVRPHSDFADKSCPGARVTPLIPKMLPTVNRPLLRIGDRGDLVMELQRRLVQTGHLNETLVTGYFDPMTMDAVKAFQREARLAEDGTVGPLTWSALGF
jgi:Putative peptidoglycan binding domain/N-acetylmuramoyl-L-alanine amidase